MNKKRNIHHKQMKSKEEYNAYMREHQRMYYREHREEWIAYCRRKRYEWMPTEEVKRLLEKRRSGNCTMTPEKRQEYIDILEGELARRGELEETRKYERSLDMKDLWNVEEQLEKLTRENSGYYEDR